MKELVEISNNVKEIMLYRKRIENDPQNVAIYEHEIWKLFSKVTTSKLSYDT